MAKVALTINLPKAHAKKFLEALVEDARRIANERKAIELEKAKSS